MIQADCYLQMPFCALEIQGAVNSNCKIEIESVNVKRRNKTNLCPSEIRLQTLFDNSGSLCGYDCSRKKVRI
jgi:hypothetical protein